MNPFAATTFSQWAGRFYFGYECSRLGKIVTYPLGNSKSSDAIVTDPVTGASKIVEVKAAKSGTCWMVHGLMRDIEYNRRRSALVALVHVPMAERRADPPKVYVGDAAAVGEVAERKVTKRGLKPGTVTVTLKELNGIVTDNIVEALAM